MKNILIVILMLIAVQNVFGESPPSTKPPIDQEAVCGKDKNGHDLPPYTRTQLWDECFMKLGGSDAPGSGKLNKNKVQHFISNNLNWLEWTCSPSAATVMYNCDVKPFDGWIDRKEFIESVNTGCLGTADHICRVKAVCDREVAALHGKKK